MAARRMLNAVSCPCKRTHEGYKQENYVIIYSNAFNITNN